MVEYPALYLPIFGVEHIQDKDKNIKTENLPQFSHQSNSTHQTHHFAGLSHRSFISHKKISQHLRFGSSSSQSWSHRRKVQVSPRPEKAFFVQAPQLSLPSAGCATRTHRAKGSSSSFHHHRADYATRTLTVQRPIR